METMEYLKAIIRSILLGLGREATQFEFEKNFEEMEGKPFAKVLEGYKKNFLDFMRTIPDVARVCFKASGYVIERVSSDKTSHMDELTIKNKSKMGRGNRFYRPRFEPYPKSNNRFQTKDSGNSQVKTSTGSRFGSRLHTTQASQIFRSRASLGTYKGTSPSNPIDTSRQNLRRRVFNPPKIPLTSKQSGRTPVSPPPLPEPNVRPHLPRVVFKPDDSDDDGKATNGGPSMERVEEATVKSSFTSKNWTEFRDTMVPSTSKQRGKTPLSPPPLPQPNVRPHLPRVVFKPDDSDDDGPNDDRATNGGPSMERVEEATKKLNFNSNTSREIRDPRLRRKSIASVPTVGQVKVDGDPRSDIKIEYMNKKIKLLESHTAWEASRRRLFPLIGCKSKPLLFYRPKKMSEAHNALLEETHKQLGPLMEQILVKKKEQLRGELRYLDVLMVAALQAYDEGRRLNKGTNGYKTVDRRWSERDIY